ESKSAYRYDTALKLKTNIWTMPNSSKTFLLLLLVVAFVAAADSAVDSSRCHWGIGWQAPCKRNSDCCGGNVCFWRRGSPTGYCCCSLPNSAGMLYPRPPKPQPEVPQGF
ncbi:hypothetical protein BOX15_Mlig020546g2, partial [Macrostomum lignano]